MWADQITPKRVIGIGLFELVYGIGVQVSLPLELCATKLQLVIEDQFFKDSLEKIIMYLHKLEDERNKLIDHITEQQIRVKKVFDRRARPCSFLKNDEVLLWDKRRESKGAHGKLSLSRKAHSSFQKLLARTSFI